MVTPLLRSPVVERTQYHGRSLDSLLQLRWPDQLDFYLPRGGDVLGKGDANVTRKYADARCVFLEGEWDAMLTVESDMIVPPDGLEKLAALDCDIAYGLYAMRHGKRQWSAATLLQADRWESLSADSEQARAAWGKVIPVKGVGNGFTLIQRHVLEALPFRNWRGVAQDWCLGIDAQARGYTQLCDTSVLCGHFNLGTGETLWPDIDAPGLVRKEDHHAP